MRAHCPRPSRLLAAAAVGAWLAVPACSDGDGSTSATTATTVTPTTSAVPTPTAPRPDGGVPPGTGTTPSTPGSPTTASSTADPVRPDLEVAVYWTRPAGGERRDLGVYADPEEGPVPYLLYGSVTNTGTVPATRPVVEVTWREDTGSVVHRVEVQPVSPTGAPMNELAPGATADLVVVVDDPSVAARLDGITPQLLGRVL